MKLATSYFYQIRNFKKNMIPVSTAISDPNWFHASLGENHIFKDKKGILNGIRCLPIIECGKAAQNCGFCKGPNECQYKPYNCPFLEEYRDRLYEDIPYTFLMNSFEELAENYKKKENIEEEIIIVLIVYETPDNPCSERNTLQLFFKKHGLECNELEYPIQKPEPIPRGEFDF